MEQPLPIKKKKSEKKQSATGTITLSLSKRAKAFAIIRKQHQQETVEDYLEAILELSLEYGEVRVSELSHYFGVSMATVNQHVKKLEAMGYITSRPYRSIFLTPLGRELARYSQEKHRLVTEFLVRIGVPSETAQLEAEGLEHHMSDSTLKCLKRWMLPRVSKGRARSAVK